VFVFTLEEKFRILAMPIETGDVFNFAVFIWSYILTLWEA
jgi:hypothetical protein